MVSRTMLTIDLLKEIVSKSDIFRGKVFLAGGAVRDIVLGNDPKDIDVVVELENGGILFAEHLARTLGVFVEGSNPVIFPRFGTAKVSLNDVVHAGENLAHVDVECVHTRVEKYFEGSRKPDTTFGTIFEDAMRRDFTINALMIDLSSSKNDIIDYTGYGLSDLTSKVIRTPLDPDITLREDPLRILRAARFAGRLGCKVEPNLEESIRKNKHFLEQISAERKREELQKCIEGPNPDSTMKLFFEFGLIQYTVPPAVALKDSTIEAAATVKKTRRLTHALGLMLYGNSKNEIEKYMKLFKFSSDEIRRVIMVARTYALICSDPSSANIRRTMYGLDVVNEHSFIECICSRMPDLRSVFFQIGDNFRPVLFFDGNQLKETFHLEDGPILRKLIELQRELWFENPNISILDVKRKVIDFLDAALL